MYKVFLLIYILFGEIISWFPPRDLFTNVILMYLNVALPMFVDSVLLFLFNFYVAYAFHCLEFLVYR